MTIKAIFKHERETKGAHRYKEVDARGVFLDTRVAQIGTVYIRKSSIPEGIDPKRSVTVTVEFN